MIGRLQTCCHLRFLKKYKILKSWYVTGRHYKSNTDPFRVFWVNPEEITHAVRGELGKATIHDYGPLVSEVMGGSWDTDIIIFKSIDVYQAFKDRFNNGSPWEETEFFKRVIKEIQTGSTKWGCTTESQFQQRCRELDELYEQITSTGYLSQNEIYRSYCDFSRARHTALKPNFQEVTVNVGRHGQLLFVDGRHRLSIAQLSEVDAIPVQIKCRHEKWQELRERIAMGDRRPQQHPDLLNV